MSLSETQAIFSELQRIEELLSKIEADSHTVEQRLPMVTAAFITTQQALRVLWRLQSLFRRMGLPEDVDAIAKVLNQLTRQVMYLYYASNLLWSGVAAGLTGGGFYGVAAGLIGIVSVQAMVLTPMEGY